MTQELPPVPGRGRRILLWTLASLLVLGGGAFATLALMPVSEDVPAGTYVAGVPVGGLDRPQVREAIAGPVAASLNRSVRLLVSDEVIEVRPADVGITVDRAATEQALFRDVPKSLLDKVRDRHAARRREDVAPVLAVRTATAQKALTSRLMGFTRTA